MPTKATCLQTIHPIDINLLVCWLLKKCPQVTQAACKESHVQQPWASRFVKASEFCVLTCPTGNLSLLGNSNYRKLRPILLFKFFSALVKALNWLSLHPGKVSFFPGMKKLASLADKGKVLFLYPLQIMVQWLLHLTGNLLPRFSIKNVITILAFWLLPW